MVGVETPRTRHLVVAERGRHVAHHVENLAWRGSHRDLENETSLTVVLTSAEGCATQQRRHALAAQSSARMKYAEGRRLGYAMTLGRRDERSHHDAPIRPQAQEIDLQVRDVVNDVGDEIAPSSAPGDRLDRHERRSTILGEMKFAPHAHGSLLAPLGRRVKTLGPTQLVESRITDTEVVRHFVDDRLTDLGPHLFLVRATLADGRLIEGDSIGHHAAVADGTTFG